MDREEEGAALTSIFFGLSGGLGPIVRNAPAAEKFKEQGARVSMSIYGEGSMAWVRRLGYELLVDDDPLMPAEDRLLLPQPTIYNVDHYFAQMGLLDEAFTESWIRHRIQMLEQERPDLVIADMSLHTLLAARALGIPSISMVQSCYHPDGKPMWHWGQAPRNLPRVTPVLNKVLARLGIAPVQRIEECFRGDMDVVPGIPELDRIYNNTVRYAGPLSYPLHPSIRPHWAGQHELSILVYPGRMEDSAGVSGRRVLEVVLQAFGGQPVTVVIASAELTTEQAAEWPDNIWLVPALPDEQVAEFDLFIHHGGHGSCMAALTYGVPSLILPTHTEREFNARAVHKLGAGEYVWPGALTASHLYHLSVYMLEDEYACKARELAKDISHRGYQGAELVYSLGTQLMESSRRMTF